MKSYRCLIPYFLVMVGMVAASIWDLPLAQLMYDPDHWLGIVFERVALLPIELVISICFYGLFQNNKQKFYLFGFIISVLIIVMDAAKYWLSTRDVWMIGLPFSLFITVILYQLLHRVPHTVWQYRERYLRFFLAVALLSLALTFAMKTLWGRVRFREMFGDVTSFTPWYVINGWNGHQSFPSAHTATMSLILCRWFQGQLGMKAITLRQKVMDGLLLITMMITRMMMGAHFLSDVLIGFTLTYTLILGVYQYMRWE